jgi:hypothetical protein
MGGRYRSTPTKASLFQIAPRAIHHRDAPEQPLTQIGRALQELSIEWIAAHSPQAKGRIERAFQTAQDRLVKGLRQVGAKDLETANQYLQQIYLPLWNRRFRRPARLAGDAHRALLPGTNLDSVLSLRESRTVSQDHTVRWHGVIYRVEREQIAAVMRGARVQLERRLDGSTWMHWRKRMLALEACEARPCVPVGGPLRHRVTHFTLCPLVAPEIAIGLEPPIEPWWTRKPPGLAC